MISLLNLAFALLAGLMLTRAVNRWHLPDVTAFLIAGVLIGPYVLGLTNIEGLGFSSEEQLDNLSVITDVAMGFIAFSIGSEFRIDDIKKFGSKAFSIGTIQALCATLVTDLVLLALHFIRPDALSASAAITLGAIASATAPAATLMVVRQYKAKGELTDLLLPIVALDDAVGLIVFAVSFGIAKTMQSGKMNVESVLFNPLIEIIASLLLGAISGWIMTQLEELFHSNRNRTSMTIGFVLLMVSLSQINIKLGHGIEIGFSSLLVCMMLGTVFCNICPLSEDIMNRADVWSQPLLAVFFVISGASLKLSVFKQGIVLLIGISYIIARSFGKYFGASLSAKLSGCSKTVIKYLGITLLPQAGVALGMCATAKELGSVDGEIIKNVVLFSVLIYELIGPLATKMALSAAGEISEKPKEIVERRNNLLQQKQNIK